MGLGAGTGPSPTVMFVHSDTDSDSRTVPWHSVPVDAVPSLWSSLLLRTAVLRLKRFRFRIARSQLHAESDWQRALGASYGREQGRGPQAR